MIRLLTTTLILLSVCSICDAQPGFQAPTVLAPKIDLDQLAIGDFDGNGLNDIAMSDIAHGNILIRYNKGGFEFADSTVSLGLVGQPHLAAGDFNMDGKCDLAYLRYDGPTASNPVGILTSSGPSFTLNEIQPLPQFSSFYKLVSIDFDKDGIVDLVAYGSPTYLLRGNGEGTFTPVALAGVNVYANGVIADMNNDDANDFVTEELLPNGDHELHAFIQQPDGTFSQVLYHFGPLAYYQLTAADFSGDGYPDMIGTVLNSTTAIYFENNGTGGGFSSVLEITLPFVPLRGLHAIDYNDDGKQDFVSGIYDGLESQTIALMENTGAGGFTNKVVENKGSIATDVVVADFDDDDLPEIASISLGRLLDIHQRQGEEVNVVYHEVAVLQPIQGLVADINKDGYADVITANLSRTIGVQYGKSDGGFEEPKLFEVVAKVYALDTADFNSDGLLDIVYSAKSNDNGTREMGVILSEPGGTLGQPVTLAVSPPSTVSTGDFNGDGHADILGGSMIYLGNGLGAFPQTISLPGDPLDVYYQAHGDLNIDGLEDVLLVLGTTVNIFYNEGAGVFSAPQELTTANQSGGVTLAFLNGDNLPDLVTSRGSGAFATAISAFINDGGGQFTETSITLEGSLYGTNVVAADFDLDGRTDIGVPQIDGPSIYLQNASGVFEHFQTLSIDATMDYLTSADLNSDGKPDLVSFGLNGVPVTLLLNDLVLEPSVLPDITTIDNLTDTSLTLNFNKGDGTGRIVLIREGSAVNGVPEDGLFYAANRKFGLGDVLNTTNYVLMRGDSVKTNITDLEEGTTYHISVFEYSANKANTVINYAAVSADISFTTMTNQTITFNPLANKTFGDADFNLSATATSGLTVSYSSTNSDVATINGNTVTIVGAGTTTITASQAGNTSYNPAPSVPQDLTVDPASQTITFDPLANKTFGDADFSLSATSTSGLTVSFSSSNTDVATVSGNTVSIMGGGTTTITASQDGNTNYTATSLSQDFTVDPASQAITFNALANKTFGDEDFTLSATSTSGLTVSYSSSNTDVATVIGNTVSIVGGGTTTITADQPGNTDYAAATSLPQDFTVDPASQVITFNALATKTFGDADFTLSATSTSDVTVSYSSSNTDVATVDGNTVTIVGAGATIITASQAGNANYIASSVPQELTVDPATQTITFPAMTNMTVGDQPITLTATTSSGLPLSYTVTQGHATIEGTLFSIVSAGEVTIKAINEGSMDYLPAPPVEVTFCINPVVPTIAVNQDIANAPLLTSSSDTDNQWISGDDIIANATGKTFSATDPGLYKVRVTIEGCSSTSAPTAIIVLGTEDPVTNMRFYPNPVTDKLMVQGAGEAEITIVDLTGRQVRAEMVRGGDYIEIDVSSIADGFFVLQVKSEQGVVQKKLIKNSQ